MRCGDRGGECSVDALELHSHVGRIRGAEALACAVVDVSHRHGHLLRVWRPLVVQEIDQRSELSRWRALEQWRDDPADVGDALVEPAEPLQLVDDRFAAGDARQRRHTT